MIPRSIEMALAVSDKSFRQLVGEESYLRGILKKINAYHKLLHPTSKPAVYKMVIAKNINPDFGLEAVTILRFLYPDVSQVILEAPDDVKHDSGIMQPLIAIFNKYQIKITY